MPDMTAQEIAAKQIQASQGAQAAYVRGIERTTKNPMERAKAAKEKMRANFNASLDDGTYDAGVDSVPMEEWRRLAKEKGGANYSRGVQAAAPKIQRFWSEWHPIHTQIKAQVDALPSATEADRENRMLENVRLRRAAKRRRGRR